MTATAETNNIIETTTTDSTPSSTQKCSRCKVNLPESHYSVNRVGRLLKTCDFCRTKTKTYRSNHRCEHKRFKYACDNCRPNNKSNNALNQPSNNLSSA